MRKRPDVVGFVIAAPPSHLLVQINLKLHIAHNEFLDLHRREQPFSQGIAFHTLHTSLLYLRCCISLDHTRCILDEYYRYLNLSQHSIVNAGSDAMTI